MTAERRTIPIDAELLSRFREAQVCFSYSRDEVAAGEGWLSRLDAITLDHAVSIEGPSALYGGPYAPNPWSADGGLCTIGACSYSHSPVPAGLVVGRYCSLAKGLRFIDFAHPSDWASSSIAFFRPSGVPFIPPLAGQLDILAAHEGSTFRPSLFDPKLGLPFPRLGHDVWIGENVALAMGITIGTGAIVATGSIVTKDVAPYTIVGGAPAKVLRERFDGTVSTALMDSEWWRYAYYDFAGIDYTDPAAFAETVIARATAGDLRPWQPKTIDIGSRVIDKASDVR